MAKNIVLFVHNIETLVLHRYIFQIPGSDLMCTLKTEALLAGSSAFHTQGRWLLLKVDR